jgi:hypothetical protein
MTKRQTSSAIGSSKLCRASGLRFAMSRGFVVLAAAMITLSSVIIASTVARSGVDHPYQTKADFDQAFAAVAAYSAVIAANAPLDVDRLRQFGLNRINLAQSSR